MVGTLIRMKLAVLRRSLNGPRRSLLFWGIAFGLVGAAITIRVSLLDLENPAIKSDLLAAVFAVWALVWALGPMLIGGEDTTLRPEYFSSIPLSSEQLATGLLGASFVGEIEALCLVAFTALIFYALPMGTAAVLVAAAALLLELVFMVILSRVITSLLREFVRSRLNAVLGSLVTGLVNAFFITGWALFVDLDRLTTSAFPPIVSTLLHVLPSGWGIVAIDAAGRGQWLFAAGALTGLGLLVLSLRTWWGALLARRLTVKRSRGGTSGRAVPGLRKFHSPTGAIVYKELLTWLRDYTRSGHLYFSLFYSLAICLYPLAAGVSIALPWAGILFVLVATGGTANLYGIDGSALWLTLTAPEAARHDVRGRQLAWLLIVGPAAILITVLLSILSGQSWALPGSLALVAAGLGAGAGLVVISSVYQLIPMTDPHLRGDDLLEHGIDPGQFLLLLFLSALLIAPALGIVILGVTQNLVWLQWAGIPVGIISGIFYFWWLGRLAHRRLARCGPELLNLVRSGKVMQSVAQTADEKTGRRLSRVESAILSLLFLGGCILLFPQGIVPLIFKLTGNEAAQLWFLPLYLPQEFQWLAVAGMITLGLSMFAAAWWIYAKNKINRLEKSQ